MLPFYLFIYIFSLKPENQANNDPLYCVRWKVTSSENFTEIPRRSQATKNRAHRLQAGPLCCHAECCRSHCTQSSDRSTYEAGFSAFPERAPLGFQLLSVLSLTESTVSSGQTTDSAAVIAGLEKSIVETRRLDDQVAPKSF